MNNNEDQFRLDFDAEKLDFAPEESPKPKPKPNFPPSPPKVPSPQDNKPETPKSYKNHFRLGLLIIALIAVWALSGEPSNEKLMEQIKSEDSTVANKALNIAFERKEKGISVLTMALNYPDSRDRAASYLKEYGKKAVNHLINVIENRYVYNKDACIEALDLLKEIKDPATEDAINNLIISAKDDRQLRRKAIRTLITILPKYREKYYMVNGAWREPQELKKRNYIKVDKYWYTPKEVLKSPLAMLEESQTLLGELESIDHIKEESVSSLRQTCFRNLDEAVTLANISASQNVDNEKMQQLVSEFKVQAHAVFEEYLRSAMLSAQKLESEQKAITAINVYAMLRKNVAIANNWKMFERMSFGKYAKEIVSNQIRLEQQLAKEMKKSQLPGKTGKLLEIYPQNAATQVKSSVIFAAVMRNSNGQMYSSPKIKWRTSGGKISKGGRFLASIPGQYEITAIYKKTIAKTNIIVVKKSKTTQEIDNIKIYPENVVIKPKKQIIFTAIISRSSGQVFSSAKIKWRTNGGKITNKGLFRAKTGAGEYSVSATYGQKTAKANVIIAGQPSQKLVEIETIACTRCNATGIINCPCKGKKGRPCPGRCMKEGEGIWKGDRRIYQYTDKKGRKVTVRVSKGHIGEVIYIKRNEYINDGKCKICNGKSYLPCTYCNKTEEITCTLCQGKKNIPLDTSNIIKLKNGTKIFGKVIGKANNLVMIKTLKGKYLKIAKDKIETGEYSKSAGQKTAKANVIADQPSKNKDEIETIACTRCNETGIINCPCKGKKGRPCPGRCMKEGEGQWEGNYRVWFYTDKQGRRVRQRASKGHIGEVLYVKGNEFIRGGICKICNGKSYLPCTYCNKTQKITCTVCQGKKIIPLDTSNMIKLKDGTKIFGKVVGKTNNLVMIKTLKGKYLKIAKDKIESLPGEK